MVVFDNYCGSAVTMTTVSSGMCNDSKVGVAGTQLELYGMRLGMVGVAGTQLGLGGKQVGEAESNKGAGLGWFCLSHTKEGEEEEEAPASWPSR